jgi:aminodeoxyfutalosine deaminase
MSYPKIELHVHLEATMKPERLLEVARRNDYPLPTDSVGGLRSLFQFRDFNHFVEVWILVTNAMRHADDFRQLVVDYAGEAARHGAVYIEGIFSPIERAARGVDWDEIFTGYCDGGQEARERHGVEVRFSPDITRSAPVDEAVKMVRYAAKYRDRGIVGIGLGGEENLYPPEPFAPAFHAAKEAGLGSVPHAGEVVGPASIWGALNALDPVRIRHGIRAIEDPVLKQEILGRGIVLDVCPVSNLRTRVVSSPEEHPLPALVDFGIPCSISTDDPELFDTDLTRDYELATSFGIAPEIFYKAGVRGALCDSPTKDHLEEVRNGYPWSVGAS